MSATMARQGGRVLLEQSDMRLALNMAELAKEGLLRTAIEETQYPIKKPRAEVQEGKKRGVEFPGYAKVKAVIDRHPAMLWQNHTAGCLSCQNGAAKNPQIHWRCKGSGAPTPDRRTQQTPQPTPSAPGTPLTPTRNNSIAEGASIVNLAAGYAYSHISYPGAASFTLDASAQDSQHDTDFDPHMLSDEGTSTG